jgi:hypothetical protein
MIPPGLIDFFLHAYKETDAFNSKRYPLSQAMVSIAKNILRKYG